LIAVARWCIATLRPDIVLLSPKPAWQLLSDFRSEFPKMNRNAVPVFKKEPERRSCAFRSNSNPALSSFIFPLTTTVNGGGSYISKLGSKSTAVRHFRFFNHVMACFGGF